MTCGIVSVEDNKTDALVIKRTLREMTSEDIIVLENGEDALDFFKNDNNTPLLILMDINIPFGNGLEILEEIRAYQHLKAVPIIMFSSSKLDEEIKKAYSLGANSYVAKPSDHDSLEDAIRHIYRYWFKISKTSFN